MCDLVYILSVNICTDRHRRLCALPPTTETAALMYRYLKNKINLVNTKLAVIDRNTQGSKDFWVPSHLMHGILT